MICTVETVLVTLWKLMTNIIIEYVSKANVHQKNFVHHTDYFIRERQTVIFEHPPPPPNPPPPPPPRIVGKMWIKVKDMWKVGQKVSFRFYFHVCAFSIQRTPLSWSLNGLLKYLNAFLICRATYIRWQTLCTFVTVAEFYTVTWSPRTC